MKTISKIIEIEIPAIPNFIRYKGFPDAAIPISEFSDKELAKIGKEWTKQLIAKAQKP